MLHACCCEQNLSLSVFVSLSLFVIYFSAVNLQIKTLQGAGLVCVCESIRLTVCMCLLRGRSAAVDRQRGSGGVTGRGGGERAAVWILKGAAWTAARSQGMFLIKTTIKPPEDE